VLQEPVRNVHGWSVAQTSGHGGTQKRWSVPILAAL